MQLTLSQKQNEYILNASHRWNLKVGAVRSGKSFVDVAYVVPSRIRAVAGLSGLNVILGVSRDTIERNVLQPMREIYTDELVGNINSSTNIAKVCGEPVYCIGAEKASQVAKIQGSSIKYCYGDEVAKWKKEVFDMLKSRLDKPYSCFDGSLNPENPNHWLKEFLDQDNLDKYIQHYTIDDNPFLSPDYVKNIKKEYAGTVYYDRYILGEWALAEGLIYPMYQDALVKELPDGKQKDHVLSIDYGTMNAFATIQWTNIDDIWYGHKNYYYSGRDTGVQKTDNEYLEAIENHFSDLINAYRQGAKEAISMGGYPPPKIKVIIDPSAASFIALLKKTDWAKVLTADNNVLDGIRETASAMHQGKLKIVDNSEMKSWKKEAGGYIWDEKSVEDKPVKVDDHDMDATRYFVKTMRLVKVKSKYTPIFN